MATIQVKRGLAANIPSTLVAGEPAFTTDTNKLYIGTGSNKVLINPDNAATATKLQTARALSLSGDVSGSASFDGSANAAITATLAGSGVTAGTYPKVTVDAKGRVTAGAALSASDIPALTLSKISNAGTAAAANTGTAVGNVPVLDANGDIPLAEIPTTLNGTTFNGNVYAGDYSVSAKHIVAGLDATINGIAVATVNDVAQAFAANDAMVFKGTLGTGGTVAALPTTGYSAGWTYRVVTAGTYAGQVCEIGDLVICVKDYATAFANSDWTVAQTNLDGVVTTMGLSTSENWLVVQNTDHSIRSFDEHGMNADDVYGAYAETTSVSAPAGTYKSVTINAKGRVTGGTNPTTLSGYGITDAAPLASPALTGTPTAPTASTGTNTTQIATTAFVYSAIAASTVDGGTF